MSEQNSHRHFGKAYERLFIQQKVYDLGLYLWPVLGKMNKEQLKDWKDILENFINDRLQLDLNDKVCIRPISLGIEFCGFRLWSNHLKLRKSTALRMRRKLRALMEDYRDGEISLERAKKTLNAYDALLSHCNSYSLRKKIFGEYTDTEWTEGWFSLQRHSTTKESDE